MKKNLINLGILFFIYLIFKNYSLVLSSAIDAVDIWLKKVFPYLFIMIFLNDLLINLGFINNFKKPSHYIFIMSLLSGSPTSAYIINNLYQKNIITKNEANIHLIYSYFANPLFLYAFFNLLFNNINITIKLIIILYSSNFLIYLLLKNYLKEKKLPLVKANFNLNNSLNKSMNILIMVLGTIVLFYIISNILIIFFNIKGISSLLLRGFLEVTQGLNTLSTFKLSLKVKEIIAIIFTSFGGLSIHLQINCILEENKLSYKAFLLGRIGQVLLASIMTTIA